MYEQSRFLRRIVQAYRWAIHNWNAACAGLSMVAVAVFSIVGPLQKYTGAAIFVAANAVVWTVIEIKHILRPDVHGPNVHANMRAARPAIVGAIVNAAVGRRDVLQVEIVGGRLRSLSDLMRELLTELADPRVKCAPVTITIHCLSSDYLRDLVLPGKLPVDEQQARNASYAHMVEAFARELCNQTTREPLRSKHVTLEVKPYDGPPLVYCYLVGEDRLFWGGYTWDSDESDFVGPENPCFELARSSAGFAETRQWLQERIALLVATAPRQTAAVHEPSA